MTLHSIGRLATVLALAALPACAADLTSPPAGAPMVMAAAGGPGGPAMGPHGHHHGHGAGMDMMAPERIEGRLAFLKAELKITDAQLPQWNAFADARRAQAKVAAERMAARHAEHEQREADPAKANPAKAGAPHHREARPLPERLANAEQMMARHLEQVRQFRATVEPLYGVLSPEQRKTADQLLGRRA